MVRQYHPVVEVKWPASAHLPYGFATCIDVLDKQVAATFEQIDGEKYVSPGDAIAAVIRHGRVMLTRPIRWKALRFSALRCCARPLPCDMLILA
jgi:hypothetical protein